jgi:uncharacterized HhH-GPD family protein
MPRTSLYLSGDAEADALLAKTALALVIGMVLDQQVPMEKAFSGPAELERRLGRPLDAARIAAMDPDKLVELFSQRPSLHRFPGSMAARVQGACKVIAEDYGNDASNIWAGAADGRQLLARVKALPGFGDQKARIFVALLGKRLGISTPGWEEASSPYGEPGSFRSVADIVDADSLARVRRFKQAAKASAKAGAPRR